ncbi:MAG: LemA family protein [Clostridia bacterium]|nr:LemA family protein [Clostridia bacterium]
MKKKGLWITLAIVLVAVIALIGVFSSNYNKFVGMEESVQNAQSDVSVYLQRRADLIPNFVETVKAYSLHEQETYTAVTEARSAVTKAESVEEQAEASAALDSAIDIWVNAVTEAYPELKADSQYIALQDELAGSENRIATARNDYNETAQEYNTAIRKFPANIVAGLFGFEKAEYFEADADAEDAPVVDFN